MISLVLMNLTLASTPHDNCSYSVVFSSVILCSVLLCCVLLCSVLADHHTLTARKLLLLDVSYQIITIDI